MQTQKSDPFGIGPSLTFDHPDATFVESLLKLGFFDIAIETCRDRYRIAEGKQLEAAAQWSMLEMHAVAAKIAANPSIIDDPASVASLLAANQVILERNQESTRWFWMKQHQQWCRWLVLRRLQAAYIAVPARKSIREWSLATIRECLEELESLQSQIQKAPARNGKSDNKSAPTPEQWSSLLNDTFLLQTDFLLLRALYYPAKSTERIAAATEMISAIEKAELRISTDWLGRPNLELARCMALIHLDRSADALSRLKSLDQKLSAPVEGKPKQSNRWRLRIASLASEACRNLGNIKESNQWINSVGGWTVAPEIAIEYFANLVTTPAGPQISESQLASALQIKKEIGLRFGSYWQQRADAILLSNNLSDSSDPGKANAPTSAILKVEVLLSEAKQLLAAKRWEEAIAKLGQAELAAANAGNETIALDIAIQASAVLLRNGQTDAGEGEFHRASMAYSKEPKAPDAAIMSVWGFDKAVRFDSAVTVLSPKDEEADLKQQVYRGRLMDIVNTWPNTAQAHQAAKKLDSLFLVSDQLPDLIALWSKRLDQATDLAAPLDSTPADRKKWSDFDQALSRLALVCTATQDAWYDHSVYLSDTMKKLRTSLDGLRTQLMNHANPDERAAVRNILATMVEQNRWPSSDSVSSALPSNTSSPLPSVSFLVQTLAPSQTIKIEESFANLDAGNLEETTKLALKWTVTELLLQRIIQNGMSKPIDQRDLAHFRSCVALLNQFEQQEDKQVLASIGMFQSMQFVRSMQLYRAAIQCWSGDESAGVQAIQASIASEPRTPWWTYRSARLFQTLGGQREQAIKQFRQLANGFPAGSEAWLESRARTAQTMRQMGNADDARKVSDIVFITYPAAAKEWQARFAQ